jgi:hypothetical protein
MNMLGVINILCLVFLGWLGVRAIYRLPRRKDLSQEYIDSFFRDTPLSRPWDVTLENIRHYNNMNKVEMDKVDKVRRNLRLRKTLLQKAERVEE